MTPWLPSGTEVQCVWIYVRKQFEVDSIVDFCRETRQLERVPRVVPPPDPAAEEPLPWRPPLQLLLHALPPPYAPQERHDFWCDVDALLSSSVESAGRLRQERESVMAIPPGAIGSGQLEGLRWPSLLVTDRWKLCQASVDGMLRSVLAQAASLSVGDLLPVVLAADFKTLCGNLVFKPAVEVSTSNALMDCNRVVEVVPPMCGPADNEVEAGRSPGRGPAAGQPSKVGNPDAAGSPRRRTFGDRDSENAVYDIPPIPDMATQEDMADEGSPLSQEVLLSPGVYIQRFNPRSAGSGKKIKGLGACCLAVMSDGLCVYSAVSSDGMRGVQANGPWEVINGHIVVGGAGKKANVSHLRLTQSGEEVLGDIAYSEAIHISLESLFTDFDFPVSLGDCVPRVGESLREELLQLRGKREEFCRPIPQTAGTSAVSSKLLSPKRGSTAVSRRSPCGVEFASTSTPHAEVTNPLRSSRLFEGGGSSVCSVPPSFGDSGQVFTLCPLRPGRYHHTTGIPDAEVYRHFEMTLHPDGTYAYSETRFHTVVRLTHRSPLWWVDAGTLVLSARGKEDVYAFLLKEPFGKRDMEQRIARLEIPVATVLAKCTYEPFEQQIDPFLGHKPILEAKRISRVLDPDSPALLDPPLPLDRVPIVAFETLLREHGWHTDEIVSDIRFLDNDADGTITVEELHKLQTYDKLQTYADAVASPALLSELREALVRRFGLLRDAFQALMNIVAADSDEPPAPHRVVNGAVVAKPVATLPQFERFLLQSAKDCKVAAKCAPLRAWLKKLAPDDIEAVFLSMNPNKGPTIDLVDFQTLSLHTSMLSVRRVEHFKRWVCDLFGRSEKSFERAFHTFDMGHKRKLTERMFIHAAAKLGYQCGPTGMRAIFGMLDRNFKGVVTVKEFVTLQSFDSGRLLQGLQDLKRFSEERFGGLEDCYKMLLKLEQAKKQTGKATSVSFRTLQKACDQGGFTKAFADVDLQSLFLFLDSASGQSSNGHLAFDEWSLLAGFDSKTINGNPARLRKFLEEEYGGPEAAFKRIQSLYQARAVWERLEKLAISGLVRAFRPRQAFLAARTAVSTATVTALKVASKLKRSLQTAAPVNAGSQLSELMGNVPKVRPHTHEGTRGRNAGAAGVSGGAAAGGDGLGLVGAGFGSQGIRGLLGEGSSGALSARTPSRGACRSCLPYHVAVPVIPDQLRGELWAPKEFRCTAAASADQAAPLRRLPGISVSVKDKF